MGPLGCSFCKRPGLLGGPLGHLQGLLANLHRKKEWSVAPGLDLWRPGKTTHSEKSIAKHVGKRHFGKTAQTGAVRKGELLRGKVSQGRPHPLSFALRCEGQTLKKKKKSWAFSTAFFFIFFCLFFLYIFSSQSVGMTLGTTS